MTIDLTDHEKRHEYMAARLRMNIAYQVRLLRLQREMSLEALYEKSGAALIDIMRAEDWDQPFPAISTLTALAKAFDCALMVSFDRWQEMLGTLVPEYPEEKAASAAKEGSASQN